MSDYKALREAIEAGPTDGPWRWEINRESKVVHLVGGRPQYDLTIMDFSRWGMSGAGINLRDTAYDGMNIMHKLQDRPDWIEPFPGRKHHAEWCANVIHPDMRMIAAADPQAIAALLAERDALLGLVSEMADNDTYETEYDGRTYSICHGCGAQDSEAHRRADCLYARARAALGEKP